MKISKKKKCRNKLEKKQLILGDFGGFSRIFVFYCKYLLAMLPHDWGVGWCKNLKKFKNRKKYLLNIPNYHTNRYKMV